MRATHTEGMPLLKTAIVTMTTAQLFDLGTFVAMVRRNGIGAEANPVVTSLVGDYGLPIAAIAKVAIIALVVAISVVLSRTDRRIDRLVVGLVLAVAIGAGLVGGGSNALTMGPMPLAR